MLLETREIASFFLALFIFLLAKNNNYNLTVGTKKNGCLPWWALCILMGRVLPI